MPRLALLLCVLLPLTVGCGQADEHCADAPEVSRPVASASWLQGFGYRWSDFNHRLSLLHLRPVDDVLEVAVVGGASTTGVQFGCVDDSCRELPWTDQSSVWAAVQTAQSRSLRFAHTTVRAEVGASGDTRTVNVFMGGAVDGDAVAFISGLRIDTGAVAAAASDQCYDSRHGWLPRSLSVSAVVSAIHDTTVDVDVALLFEAGESGEPIRACMDAVAAQAVVAMELDIAIAAGVQDVQTQGVESAVSYGCDGCPLDPPAQPPPASTTIAIEGDLLGWQSLEFLVRGSDAFPRGAYLTSMDVNADVSAGTAVGHVTNLSPGTQQSGLDAQFRGVIVTASADDRTVYTRRYTEQALPAEIDEITGTASIFTLFANQSGP